MSTGLSLLPPRRHRRKIGPNNVHTSIASIFKSELKPSLYCGMSRRCSNLSTARFLEGCRHLEHICLLGRTNEIQRRCGLRRSFDGLRAFHFSESVFSPAMQVLEDRRLAVVIRDVPMV